MSDLAARSFLDGLRVRSTLAAMGMDDPNLGARVFAQAHYRAGHRYRITGVGTDAMHVVCECGMESQPDRVDYPR